jgi:hypothetical protein
MCWIGLARKVSESDRAVLLEEDVRWERGYHTRGVSRAGPRYGSKDTSEARAVRTACGGIVESAPESGSSSVPTQRARKSQGLRGTSCRDNIPCFLPHRSIHD